MTMLLLLLAVSCGRKEQTGTPYILYEIHGTVTDSDGNPLSGIRVMSGTSEPVYTSSGGTFVLFGKSAPSSSESAVITCDDMDGEANGGFFMKTNQNVPLRLRNAGSGNNKGNYFASEVVVTMILKNEGIQDGGDPPTPY